MSLRSDRIICWSMVIIAIIAYVLAIFVVVCAVMGKVTMWSVKIPASSIEVGILVFVFLANGVIMTCLAVANKPNRGGGE